MVLTWRGRRLWSEPLVWTNPDPAAVIVWAIGAAGLDPADVFDRDPDTGYLHVFRPSPHPQRYRMVREWGSPDRPDQPVIEELRELVAITDEPLSGVYVIDGGRAYVAYGRLAPDDLPFTRAAIIRRLHPRG